MEIRNCNKAHIKSNSNRKRIMKIISAEFNRNAHTHMDQSYLLRPDFKDFCHLPCYWCIRIPYILYMGIFQRHFEGDIDRYHELLDLSGFDLCNTFRNRTTRMRIERTSLVEVLERINRLSSTKD